MCNGGNLLGSHRIRNGNDKRIGAVEVRCAQDVDPRRIAEKDTQAAHPAGGDPLRREIENEDRHPFTGEKACDRHADLAKAGDHHMTGELSRLFLQVA